MKKVLSEYDCNYLSKLKNVSHIIERNILKILVFLDKAAVLFSHILQGENVIVLNFLQ